MRLADHILNSLVEMGFSRVGGLDSKNRLNRNPTHFVNWVKMSLWT